MVVVDEASSNESFRGRFLIRDDNVRSDAGVWDVCGTALGSFILDPEN